MNYSDDPSSVRVDFFKPSGKWYTTEAVKMGRGIGGLIHEDFAEALDRHLREGSEVRLSGMTAVCLEPHHEHSHPLMMTVKRAIEIADNQEE